MYILWFNVVMNYSIQPSKFHHQRPVFRFQVAQQNIYLNYFRFIRVIKLILHLLLYHFSPGHLISPPLLIHIPPIGQIRKIIRSTCNILHCVLGI